MKNKLMLVLLLVVSFVFIPACGSKKEFTVKFETNSETTIDEQNVLENDKIIIPENPVKEGYKFIGWKIEGSDSNEPIDLINLKITEDLKLVGIWEEIKPNYPDLKGYNIKVAVASHLVEKIKNTEILEKIDEQFKCNLEILPYPEDAIYGPARWKYILDNINNNTMEFDIIAIPADRVKFFAENNALNPLTLSYKEHATQVMNKGYIDGASYKDELYGINYDRPNVLNVMYYNVDLFNELQKLDNTLVEPAKLFLEGKWTFTKFKEYSSKIQELLEKKYGNLAKANSKDQEYFSVSGELSKYFGNMVTNNGVKLLDNNVYDFTGKIKEEAANILKEMVKNGLVNKKQLSFDNNTYFKNGKAFFTNADLINTPKLEQAIGYVPFPMADEMKLDDYKIGLSMFDCFAFPKGKIRENQNIDDIFYAFSEYLKKITDKRFYDNEKIKFATKDANDAYLMIQDKITNDLTYYEEYASLNINTNPIDILIKSYCIEFKYETFKEAIEMEALNETPQV